jgi:hypothetical protein
MCVQEAAGWYKGPISEAATVLSFMKEVPWLFGGIVWIFETVFPVHQNNELPAPVLQLLNEMIAVNAKIRCLLYAEIHR